MMYTRNSITDIIHICVAHREDSYSPFTCQRSTTFARNHAESLTLNTHRRRLIRLPEQIDLMESSLITKREFVASTCDVYTCNLQKNGNHHSISRCLRPETPKSSSAWKKLREVKCSWATTSAFFGVTAVKGNFQGLSHALSS